MGHRLIEQFNDLIEVINNEELRKVVHKLLEAAPDYITVCPASSTGKYHPADEIGENGMILHIRRCATIAIEVTRMYGWDQDAQDLLIAGSMLHDVYKQGLPTNRLDKHGIEMPKVKHTTKLHPIYIFDRIRDIADAWPPDDPLYQKLYDLAHMCLFHEGRWTIDQSRDAAVVSKMTPYTKRMCEAMHLVDMMACKRPVADMFQYIKPEELATILKAKYKDELEEVELESLMQTIVESYQ